MNIQKKDADIQNKLQVSFYPDRISGQKLIPAEISIFADSECGIGEGPFYARNEHRLYWVNPDSCQYPDMPGCLLRKTGTGTGDFESFDPEIGTVSAYSQKEDGTFLLFASGCRVWTWKPGGKAGLFAQIDGGRFKFNDVTTTPDGHVFCSVLPEDLKNGTGELFDLSPDGTFCLLDTCRGIPNGMGFSPDRTTFYFTATSEETIYRYHYENGQISRKEIFVSETKCDGLAIDTVGGIWSAGWQEKIRRFDPSGELTLEITFPGIIVSSLCFGGREWNDIYITTANYPYSRKEFLSKHAGAVLVWKNSPYKGMKIPFFGNVTS